MNGELKWVECDDGTKLLKYEVPGTDADILTRRMVENADMQGIIKPSCFDEPCGTSYYYSSEGLYLLSDYLRTATAEELLWSADGLIQACISVEDYILEPFSLCLDPDFVFVDCVTGNMQFLCLPGTEAGFKEDERTTKERAHDFICQLLRSRNKPADLIFDSLKAMLRSENLCFSHIHKWITSKKNDLPYSVLEQKNSGHIFEIDKNETVLGRSQGQDVKCVSDSPAVSRSHSRLEFEEGGWLLRDLEASNGTKVNGRPVKNGEAVPVHCNDEITMADEKFIFYC